MTCYTILRIVKLYRVERHKLLQVTIKVAFICVTPVTNVLALWNYNACIYLSFQRRWLKLRNLTLRAFAASMCLCQSMPDSQSDKSVPTVNGDRKSLPDVLEMLIGQIEQLVQEVTNEQSFEIKVLV